MPHDSPLTTMLTLGLGLAFVFGAVATRLRFSPLVGYLLAGVVVGPFTPGFVANAELAQEVAEIGVILLMFGVGLHFSLKDLLSVRAVAIPGALAQIVVATLLGLGLALLMGWGVEAGIVFGLALSVASTVVLLRTLQERRIVQTDRGRIAVGWLIVEDLATVIALVLLPTWAGIRADLADNVGTWPEQIGRVGFALLLTVGKVVAFVGLMLVVGRRFVPWMLHRVAHMASRELFRLAVLAIALGVAMGAAQFFGVSFALGAFFAGMIMAESELSQQAASETLPLRDAFAVLFFVSVGMLFDPLILIENPWPLLGTLFIIVVGKSAAALGIMALFKQPRSSAVLIAVSLAQIGEFSFILAGLGVGLGFIPEEARDLVLAGAILSIMLNPLMFFLSDRWLARAAAAEEAVPAPAAPPPRRRAVLVGYGRVGSLIGKALDGAMAEYLVIEDKEDLVENLRARDIAVVAGNAVSRETMEAANVSEADLMFVTVPDGFEAGRIVQLARTINPGLKVYARAHSEAEVEHLKSFGADLIVSGEREIADAMIQAATHIIPRRLPASA